ncbi:hypothetical protein [Thermococcus camini]|nr:hypothetical protein [Thermococcus camini]
MKVGRKHVFLVVLIFLTATVAYALHWLHLNPIADPGGREDFDLRGETLTINASTFPARIDRWELIGALRTSCVETDIRVCLGIRLSGRRNVAGTQVRISAPVTVEALPLNSSVQITRAEVRVLASGNTWLGDVIPDNFVGFPVFKSLDGPFRVEARSCGDPNEVGCMVATPNEPAWGRRLLFEAWPDFIVNGNPPAYSGNVTFVVAVEYEVRTGLFTAEKRWVRLEFPLRLELHDVGTGTT